MTGVREISVFSLGTAITSNNQPHSLLGKIIAYFTNDERNFNAQLTAKCMLPAENMLVLSGPGTDLVSDTHSVKKIINSLGGLIDGHIGEHGIPENLKKIRQFLETHAQHAVNNDEELKIHFFGYSRGAVEVSFAKTEVAEVMEDPIFKHLKIEGVYIFRFDGVLGGLTDRLRFIWKQFIKPLKNPKTKLVEFDFFSHTGNPNIWDSILNWLKWFSVPSKWCPNTFFFSAFRDNTKKMPDHPHVTVAYLVPANHEGTVGRPMNAHEEMAGDVVLAHVLTHSSLPLDPKWKADKINKGKKSLQILREQNITCETSRNILGADSIKSATFGSKLRDHEGIISILDIEFSEDKVTASNNFKMGK